MINTLEKIKKTLEESYDVFRDSATNIIDKAEDFGKISKLKFEIRQITVSVEKKLTVLGDAVYNHLIKNDVEALKNNPAIKLVVEEIQDLYGQIETKQKQIDELVAENQEILKSKEQDKMQKKIEILEQEINERMSILKQLKNETDEEK